MGGTKIEVLVMSNDGQTLFRDRVATPKENYQNIINAIVALISSAETNVKKECSVGICTPGSLSLATGLLRNSNTTCLNDMPFKQDLERALTKEFCAAREVRLENDANCFALSEAIDGSAKKADSVFGVIVGTGTGGGMVIARQLLTGCNSIAGEWGHNPLPWPDDGELAKTKCWCGQQGCVETFISGPGLEKDFQRATQKVHDAESIVELANQGNVAAGHSLARYEHRMARSLAHVINLFDPEVIVLGGGMSNVQRLYQNVPKLWKQWIFSDSVNTKLVSPKFGDASGVRGAAWLWNNQ